MLTREIAKYPDQDRIRAAEQDRVSRPVHDDRYGGRTAVVRKVGAVSARWSSDAGARPTPTSSTVGIPLV